MRLLLVLSVAAALPAQQSPAEKLIEDGHWKRARSIVEAGYRQAPGDALWNFLLSQLRGAFGDRSTPLMLAEKAVELDGRTAKYHRQIAEVVGVTAQRAGAFQQLFLARRFRKEIDLALACDPRDLQSLRDQLEYDLLAPGIVGGDPAKAEEAAAQIARIDPVEGLLAHARIAEFHKDPLARESFLRQAAEAPGPQYRARIALARFYLEGSRTNLSAAAVQAEAARALAPGRVDAYAVLAAIHADRGEWGRLDALLASVQREVPDDAVAHYRAAERLLNAGRDPSRAEQYLLVYLGEESEGNQPTASEARWKLAQALEAQGRIDAAIEALQESLRLDPESKAAQDLKRLRGVRAGNATRSTRQM